MKDEDDMSIGGHIASWASSVSLCIEEYVNVVTQTEGFYNDWQFKKSPLGQFFELVNKTLDGSTDKELISLLQQWPAAMAAVPSEINDDIWREDAEAMLASFSGILPRNSRPAGRILH